LKERREDQERIRILPCPGVPGVELVWAARVTRSFPRHAHSGQLLGLVDQGGRRFTLRKGDAELAAGALFGLGPDVAHACEPLDRRPHSYRAIRFDARSLLALGLETPVLLPGVPQRLSLTGNALRLSFCAFFERASELAQAWTAAHDLDLAGDLRARLAALLDRAGRLAALSRSPLQDEAPAPHAVVVRAQEYILRRFDQVFTLDELGLACGCSPFHLHRLFVREVGLTPLESQLKLRIRKVRSLLEAGETLAQASLSAGFFDQSHCSRHFKRLVGVSPAHLARTLRK
jgi:AraC-like DNA-binding protein